MSHILRNKLNIAAPFFILYDGILYFVIYDIVISTIGEIYLKF
ncbi:hypothetical protein WG947_08120 [Pontibacter sp. H259]